MRQRKTGQTFFVSLILCGVNSPHPAVTFFTDIMISLISSMGTSGRKMLLWMHILRWIFFLWTKDNWRSGFNKDRRIGHIISKVWLLYRRIGHIISKVWLLYKRIGHIISKVWLPSRALRRFLCSSNRGFLGIYKVPFRYRLVLERLKWNCP